MNTTINGRTSDEIKEGLECCAEYGNCSKGCPYNPIKDCGHDLYSDALTYIQQLERERDELKNKPMAWEDVIMSDSFLEVKDEYVGAALLQCAFSHDEYCADDEVTFTTHLNDLKIYHRSEYGKSWRCWPRFPTDEERAAAKWEVNDNGEKCS